jgi:hypothetical protein
LFREKFGKEDAGQAFPPPLQPLLLLPLITPFPPCLTSLVSAFCSHSPPPGRKSIITNGSVETLLEDIEISAQEWRKKCSLSLMNGNIEEYQRQKNQV